MIPLGDAVWFVSGGWLAGLLWLVAAVLCHLSVIGIPFSIAWWRIARFAFFPFGKEIVDAQILGGSPRRFSLAGRILWIVVVGWWVALGEAIAAALALLSSALIIPIFVGGPISALGHAKLAQVAFDPLGMRSVPVEAAKRLRE